ncbi:hydrolase [Dietzia sp. NCCP-2495]|uniref:alpha/beta fold hydrolase n=1 Tax=Dietzia sp. NCCP-2495 TaxID=2934675 RepID=UPI00222F27AA|nr:alpha/beta hydrolase [Dietzia sp. NCCP-2495]GLB63338.1 hydrolase [Dietzia sp. NCCP-2495]
MDLYHRVTGTGPTIVLIHGVCHRGHAWDPVVPLLADRYRLVIVDLPGHGNSPDLPIDGDPLEYMVDQLTTLLDGILEPGERAHIAGNSLGGFLALEMAARGHAHSATALSPAGFFRSNADWKYTLMVFHSLQKTAGRVSRYIPALSQRAAGRAVLMGAFCTRPWKYPAEAAAIDGEAIITNTVLDRADRRAFVFSAPVDEDMPLTIRWGRFDLVLPVAQRRLASLLFPQARIEVSRDGHVPMSDDPEGVAASIAATVERGLARERELADERSLDHEREQAALSG